MNDAIRHRGPDDEGFVFLGSDACWFGGPDTPAASFQGGYAYTPSERWDGQVPAGARVALGHRRLSILDLSSAGHQPMASADGRYWITFNGEVYNYLEIRAELEALGHRFVSHTDTEVVLAAYTQWGRDCLRRFVGMWALLLVDRDRQRAFAARDFFGIKPLYFARFEGGVAFASECKALLQHPAIRARVNAASLFHYIECGLNDHSAETLFADIQQMPPANCMEFSLDDLSNLVPERYWAIDLAHKLDLSFDEAARTLQDLFLQSVRLHLRSDVPVGAALSGGVDSSAIVMGMRRVAGPDLQLHSFSYIAEDQAISEEPWMDLVAEAAGARPHKSQPGSQDLVSELEYLLYMQDVPFGSTSIYAQHRVFGLAAEHGIKVMLDGQGADEMLAGYNPYALARLKSLVRQGRLVEAVTFVWNATRYPGRDFLWRQLPKQLVPAALISVAKDMKGARPTSSWLDARWFSERSASAPTFERPTTRDLLREELHHSFTTISLPGLLRYEDRNSMAHSIESRVPFLTPDIVSFLFSLPEEYLLSQQGVSKAVFRAAMRGLVPDPILDRKDKIGFATPERRWLSSLRPWVESVLSSETAMRLPMLRPAAMKAEWQAMLESRSPFDWRFWRWINFIRWSERYQVVFE